MKTKDVIGQRIIGVEQVQRRDSNGQRVMDVGGISLGNGKWITFSVAEMAADYAVEADVTGKPSHPKRRGITLELTRQQGEALWEMASQMEEDYHDWLLGCGKSKSTARAKALAGATAQDQLHHLLHDKLNHA